MEVKITASFECQSHLLHFAERCVYGVEYGRPSKLKGPLAGLGQGGTKYRQQKVAIRTGASVSLVLGEKRADSVRWSKNVYNLISDSGNE
eukprot:scaffold2720_cov173-Amphora_coffeaeformis.AAC.4